MAVEITRGELSAAELRRAAGQSKDAKTARRMLALALVLEGRSRTEAAESCGMDRQTLRDWVHGYNAEGLAGLTDRPLAGTCAEARRGTDERASRDRREGAGPGGGWCRPLATD